MTSLQHYGWNSFQQQHYTSHQIEGQSIGRVISIKGFKYYLITEHGERNAELAGKLLYGTDPEDLPKVGDWVFFLDYGETGYIVGLFPRMNFLSRRNPGNKTEKQILAANIEYALIVQGLDRDFNIMRLERYLTQVTACGIVPIVVLNKADLVDNLEVYRYEVLKLKRDCSIFFCSTVTGLGIQSLKDALEKDNTYVLIGSSGVGKSTLLNILLDTDIQRTGTTSEWNNKGKHTTTTRDLFQLPNGSLLIDTPGMREFGVTEEDVLSQEALFPAIHAVAAQCRYGDCRHLNEAGCAVLEALAAGNLDITVYESYIKLMKEQKRFEINTADKKRLNKQFGKITREAKNYRKKYKY